MWQKKLTRLIVGLTLVLAVASAHVAQNVVNTPGQIVACTPTSTGGGGC